MILEAFSPHRYYMIQPLRVSTALVLLLEAKCHVYAEDVTVTAQRTISMVACFKS